MPAIPPFIRVPVFGCGYRRIADASCSATTPRRRRDERITLGLGERLHLLVLDAHDRNGRPGAGQRGRR
jgi:hypothetical protein